MTQGRLAKVVYSVMCMAVALSVIAFTGCSSSKPIVKTTPTITWATPAAITAGTALSATQLNATASVAGTFAYTPAAGTVESKVGAVTLSTTFTPSDTTHYNSATGSVQLTVNQGTPTITWAAPAAVTVGTALSATQLNATASVAGTFAYTPAAGTVESAAGTVTLKTTFTPTDTTDFTNATASVQLTVNKGTPTIAWATPAPVNVGTALSATQLDATASVPGTFQYTPGSATVESTPSTVTLNTTFTPTDTADYNTAMASVQLVVVGTPTITWPTPAPVTVGTALSATQLDATASVPGTFVYSSVIGTVESMARTVTLMTTFTPTDAVHYHTATASVQLTVNKGTPTITWPTPAGVPVGATLSATQLDATANVPGTFVYTPAAGTVESTAGTFTLNTTFTPTDTADYTTATASVQLIVANKTNPIITWPTPAPVPFGTALSSTQLNATANVAGTFAYTPSAGTVESAVGTVTLNTTFTPTDTTLYNTATASVQLTVTQATPVLNWATPAAITAGAALSATQLDATSNVPGAFVYNPPSGTVESAAGTFTLKTTFTPTDAVDYTTATASVQLVVNAVVSGQPNYTWGNVAIVAGGYVPGTYFHPTTKNLMYARTDVGGLYRWGPNDTQWVQLLDFIDRTKWWDLGVEAVGFDPTNDKNLYVAVGAYALEDNGQGDGEMLISHDQGNTFTSVAFPFYNGSNDNGRNTGDRISVDPNMPGIIYFGTRLAGLQISTDAGSTWTQSTNLKLFGTSAGTTNNGTGVVQVIPIASSGSSGKPTPVVYAAVAGTGAPVTINAVTTNDAQGLYVTTNGGTAGSTWTAVAGQPTNLTPTPLAVLRAYYQPLNGEMYVLYGDQTGPGSMNTSQLWKFKPTPGTWTSGTWTQLTLPNPGTDAAQRGFGGIAIDPENAGVLLLGTLDQYALFYEGEDYGDEMYRSTDDGVTWENIGRRSFTPINGIKGGGGNHDGSLSPWLGFGGEFTNVGNGNWATGITIDPFDPNHAMYGTGQTIWSTTNLTDADSGKAVDWTVGAQGVEETVTNIVVALPSGPTILLTGMGDIYGFAHTDLTKSPAKEMYNNPMSSPTSIDFEQNTPTNVYRISTTAPFGVYATDGGASNTWTAFATNPTKTKAGGGQIAVSCDGSALLWAPLDTTSIWYSTDKGNTWNPSTGIPPQIQIVSDRVQPGVFYGFNNGALYVSRDKGATFTFLQRALPSNATLYTLPDAQGDIVLAALNNGVWINGGTPTAPVLKSVPLSAKIQQAYHIGFGASIGGSKYLTLFLDGNINGINGVFRSTDFGTTWVRINDDAHAYTILNAISGDMRTPGTIYLATPGRGIIWGTSPN